MGHVIIRDDATGIGVGKSTLDHQAERELPHEFFARTVVRLFLQQTK
jgi:hypothetical protein